MRTLTAVPASMAGSGAIRKPGTVRFGIAAKRGRLKRFQRFIETTDWDERFVCGRWIDKLCMGCIALATGYFGLIFSAFLAG